MEVRTINKHDTFVEQLREELSGYYDKTIKHYTFFSRTKTNRKTTKGEVDLLCFKGNEIHAFEVKCSYRISKAKKQMKKIKRNLLDIFTGIEDVKTFFYCGSSGSIEQLLVEE